MDSTTSPVYHYLVSPVSSTAVLASAKTTTTTLSPLHHSGSRVHRGTSRTESHRSPTLGFCVHIDFEPVVVSSSRKQVYWSNKDNTVFYFIYFTYFTYLHVCLIIHSFIHLFTHPFIHLFYNSCIHSFVYLFVYLFVCLLLCMFYFLSFCYFFLYSFIYSFIHSFVYLFIHFLIRQFFYILIDQTASQPGRVISSYRTITIRWRHYMSTNSRTSLTADSISDVIIISSWAYWARKWIIFYLYTNTSGKIWTNNCVIV
jgi:hypothetical protein